MSAAHPRAADTTLHLGDDAAFQTSHESTMRDIDLMTQSHLLVGGDSTFFQLAAHLCDSCVVASQAVTRDSVRIHEEFDEPWPRAYELVNLHDHDSAADQDFEAQSFGSALAAVLKSSPPLLKSEAETSLKSEPTSPGQWKGYGKENPGEWQNKSAHDKPGEFGDKGHNQSQYHDEGLTKSKWTGRGSTGRGSEHSVADSDSNYSSEQSEPGASTASSPSFQHKLDDGHDHNPPSLNAEWPFKHTFSDGHGHNPPPEDDPPSPQATAPVERHHKSRTKVPAPAYPDTNMAASYPPYGAFNREDQATLVHAPSETDLDHVHSTSESMGVASGMAHDNVKATARASPDTSSSFSVAAAHAEARVAARKLKHGENREDEKDMEKATAEARFSFLTKAATKTAFGGHSESGRSEAGQEAGYVASTKAWQARAKVAAYVKAQLPIVPHGMKQRPTQ